MLQNKFWWNGPQWLVLSPSLWPSLNVDTSSPDIPELKQSPVALVSVETVEWDFDVWSERLSTYNRLIRSMAYILRFTPLTHQIRPQLVQGAISSMEFDRSVLKCVELLQHKYYADVFSHSSLSKVVQSLKCFLDNNGIIRVGGRISQAAELPYDMKHPLLLPRRCHFNNLLIDNIHQESQHAGCTVVQSTLQQRFWIPAVKRLIRQRIHSCMKCFRGGRSIKPLTPIMSDLPSVRLSGSRAFHAVGVDFAGPFMCKESPRRNAKSSKAYLCLFICLAVKTVHLEVVPNLSIEAFLDALDRFISRRGLPAIVYSDCGRNFVGTCNYLKELDEWHSNSTTQRNITDHVASKGIDWKFNPPYAPHFGGIWESNIKVAKSLLRYSIGYQAFTEDELTTMFTKIEAVMNSRPLCAMSSDPDDLQPLTPGHFIIGEPLQAIPEYPLLDSSVNRHSRWQRLRQNVQSFWSRWHHEYLTSFQLRPKWTHSIPNIKVGELAVVRDQSLVPCQWPLGRIIEVYPGQDGVVRVAKLKTSGGDYIRAVSKLIPLPLQPDTEPDP